MINAEKYKDKILAMKGNNYWFSIDKRDNQLKSCGASMCSECLINTRCNNESCRLAQIEWLLSKYKEPIKLTRFEYEVLGYLFKNKQYRFIVRERNGYLYTYINKPRKHNKAWQALTCMRSMNLFNNLFQFIQWEDEEPTSIEEVLKNCEVIEK